MLYFPGETLTISEALCRKGCLANEGERRLLRLICEFPALRASLVSLVSCWFLLLSTPFCTIDDGLADCFPWLLKRWEERIQKVGVTKIVLLANRAFVPCQNDGVFSSQNRRKWRKWWVSPGQRPGLPKALFFFSEKERESTQTIVLGLSYASWVPLSFRMEFGGEGGGALYHSLGTHWELCVSSRGGMKGKKPRYRSHFLTKNVSMMGRLTQRRPEKTWKHLLAPRCGGKRPQILTN